MQWVDEKLYPERLEKHMEGLQKKFMAENKEATIEESYYEINIIKTKERCELVQIWKDNNGIEESRC